MKRFISLMISVMLVISSLATVGFASEEHWAYSIVSGLVDDGIVSGDQNGNLNLDNYITRAEFTKTINRYFNITEKSISGFSDVPETKWYYNEMLIAKKAGYIKGDENGFANPELNITRAEVSVIIARLLGLPDNFDYSFSDLNNIPDWAKGAVGALYSKGIIKGYNDNTFKANNSITRAEAFVIVSRNNKNDYKETNNVEASSAAGTYIPSGSSGGGSVSGGSSGGGTAIIPPSIGAATISTRYFDSVNKTLEFVSQNATGYSIKFNVGGTDYLEQPLTVTSTGTDYKTASFADLAASLLSAVGQNGFNADVYVQATGTVNSGYVKFGTAYFEYDIEDVKNINIAYNTTTENYDISWDAVSGATGYKVLLYKDASLGTPEKSFEEAGTSYTVDTSSYEFLDTYYVSVVAKVDGIYDVVKSHAGSIVKGFGGGDGTVGNPYLVYTKANLSNVKKASDKAFKQMADIGSDSDKVTEPVTEYEKEFTGSYDGNNKSVYISLTSNTAITDNTKEGFGLFPKINGATIENLSVYGDVSGKGNVGALVGWGTGKCTIKNIKNYAFVQASAYFGAGIIGRLYDGELAGTVVENLCNYGEVKSSGTAGGVIGVTKNAYTVKNCSNYGYVYCTNTLGSAKAGGVVSTAYGDITGCYNFGKVECKSTKGAGISGGIAGNVSNANITISNCFNAGEVLNASSLPETYTAAIVNSSVKDSGEKNIPIIKNCYNLYKDVNLGDGSTDIVYENSYTLNELDTGSGITNVTASELILKDISSDFTLFEENKQNSEYNVTYRYPQIKDNLVLKSYQYNDTNFVMTIKDISYDSQASKWYVEITPTVKGIAVKYTLSLGNNLSLDITEFNAKNKYEITNVPTENVSAILKAYDESTALIDTSEAYSAKFAATVTDISVNASSLSLSFNSENASAYKIKFNVGGTDYLESDLAVTTGSGNEKTASFAGTKDALITAVGVNGFNADVYIKAIGNEGYASTDYIKAGTVFIGDVISDVTGINAVYNKNTDKYDVSWSAVSDAVGYKVYTYADATLTTKVSEEELSNVLTYSLDATNSSLYNYGTKYYVTVVAKVGSFFGAVNSSNNASFVSGFAGGSGTDADPYVIASYSQFAKVFTNGSTADITKTYLLTGFDTVAMEIPSTYKPLGVAFTGKLIGGNIENGVIENVKQKINIASLTFETTDKVGNYQGGLFHQLNGATVKNLSLSGTVTSSADISGTSYFGGLSGYLAGSCTIDNIDSSLDITSYQDYATGGFFGSSGVGVHTVSNLVYKGNLTGKKHTAGIIGDKFRMKLGNSYNYGTITGTERVAGIAGEQKDNANDTIINCGNYGNITATGGVAGGIAGATRKPIQQCFNAGTITASTYAGGIIGEVATGKTGNVTNCFNLGEIKGTSGSGLAIGKLVGTSTVKGFYDILNPSVTSLAGVKSGTLNASSAYSYGTTTSETANDVSKVTKDTIKELTGSSDSVFTDSTVWTLTGGFGYPNLVSNPYTGSNIE